MQGSSGRSIAIRIALLALIPVLAATHAAAQTYPAKSVRMMVPFASGGPADIFARVVGQRL